MNYVFVCRHGISRSYHASCIAQEIAAGRGISLDTEFFGTVSDEPELEKMRKLAGAHRAYVMEEYMRPAVQALGYTGPVACLHIPDTALSYETIRGKMEQLDFSPPAPPEDPWILRFAYME